MEKENSPEFNEENFKIVTTKNGYKVKIPEYFFNTTTLNKDASAQFQNVLKEEYLIVIHENKSQMIETLKKAGIYNDNLSALENYKEFQVRNTVSNLIIREKPKSTPFDSKLGKAFRVQLRGKAKGVSTDTVYFLAFYEGKENFYFWVGWTLDKMMEEKKSLFEYLQEGFSEL